MAPLLYMVDYSPPVRAVMMTAKALNIPMQCKEVDLIKKEQLQPYFTKLNPQHTIPTLVDKTFVIWDSHAIMAYLVGKYAQNDSLYPRDVEKRAIIDQRLHFDSGVLFSMLRQIMIPFYNKETKTVTEDKIKSTEESYDFLEKFLNGHKWIAGTDNITIADFSLMTTVQTLDVLVPIDEKRFPYLLKWIKRVKETNYYDEENESGLQSFKKLLKTFMNS